MSAIVLGEISEAQADANTRAIYEDIKRISGTSLVNLIYRHLATMPSALEWAWTNISRDDGYAKLLAASQRLPRHRLCTRLPAPTWRLAGLTDEAVAAMSQLVAQYNKTNALNLVAVTCLLRGIGAAAAQGLENDPKVRSETETTALPLNDLRRLQVHLNEVVTGAASISPTMFRNFEQWPVSLAVVAAILAPLEGTGAFAAARQASLDRALEIADQLQHERMVITPLADAQLAGRVAKSLSLFQRSVIASMLPVGHALADALGEGA